VFVTHGRHTLTSSQAVSGAVHSPSMFLPDIVHVYDYLRKQFAIDIKSGLGLSFPHVSNNNNSNDNASHLIAQNKPSSVALTAVQTNMSRVSRQKSTKNGCRRKVHWKTVAHKMTSDHKVACAERSPGSVVSRPKVSFTCHSCDRHTVVGQIWNCIVPLCHQ